jgi:hypothetical protein
MPFEEAFLVRWSRRKAEHRSTSGSVDPVPARDPAPEMNSAPESVAEPKSDLDCASLEFSSDFSRFVCNGISDAVQTAALRRLWVTSPLFGASDGLDVYRADYTGAAPLGDVPAAASRTLQMIAGGQCAADRPVLSPRAPTEVASSARQENAPPSDEQEPHA